ncbi:MAG TPA: hypothetical protein VKA84_27490 [Gemmatimonadaceae bacterium]|nr:hypothetical protein [Gemmatimonadaceae bacterium]
MMWTTKAGASLLLAACALTAGCRADSPRRIDVPPVAAASSVDCVWHPASSSAALLDEARALVQLHEDGRVCITDADRRRIAYDSAAMRYFADVAADREPGLAESALRWMAEGARPELWPTFAAALDRQARVDGCAECVSYAGWYGLARYAHLSAEARARLDRAADSVRFRAGDFAWVLAAVNDSAARAVLRRLRGGGLLDDSLGAPGMAEIVDSVLAWPALPPGEGRACVEDQTPGRTASGAFGCVPRVEEARAARLIPPRRPIAELGLGGARFDVAARGRALRQPWGPVVELLIETPGDDRGRNAIVLFLRPDTLALVLDEVARMRRRAYLSWIVPGSAGPGIEQVPGSGGTMALVVRRRAVFGEAWEVGVLSAAAQTPRSAVRLSEWEMYRLAAALGAATRQARAYEALGAWPRRDSAGAP